MPIASPGCAAAIEAASCAAGWRTIRLALVTMPSSCARTMPAFTPGERPRSSALTMRKRSPPISEFKSFGKPNRIGEPVVALSLGRDPTRWRPTERLHGEVQARQVELARRERRHARDRRVGGHQPLAIGAAPIAAEQRRQVEQAGSRGGLLPVHRRDAYRAAIATGDEHVGSVEVA